MAGATYRDRSSSLYVGDLNLRDVTEAQLLCKFSAIGPVTSIKLCPHSRHQAGKESLSHAFVNFAKRSDAERALETLHFAPMGKSKTPMRLMWYAAERTEESNLYIKNIARSIEVKALHALMDPYGSIISCKIAKDHRGQSLGHGFVQYVSEESADAAIRGMNGVRVCGLQLYVGKFMSKHQRERHVTGHPRGGSREWVPQNGRLDPLVKSPSKPSPPEKLRSPNSHKVVESPSGSDCDVSIPDASVHSIVGNPTSRPTCFSPSSDIIQEQPSTPVGVPAKNSAQDVRKSLEEDFMRCLWVAPPARPREPVAVSREYAPAEFGGIGSRPSMQPARIHTYRDAVTVAPLSESLPDSPEKRIAQFNQVVHDRWMTGGKEFARAF